RPGGGFGAVPVVRGAGGDRGGPGGRWVAAGGGGRAGAAARPARGGGEAGPGRGGGPGGGGGGGRPPTAAGAARRPAARGAGLAGNGRLREYVQARLMEGWSPGQIAAVLAREFPDEPEMRVCHETIYQAIYVQGRGALRRELAACLRTGRAARRPRGRPGERRGRHPGRGPSFWAA